MPPLPPRLATLLLAAALAAPAAADGDARYEDPEQLQGAALMALSSLGPMVARAASHCGALDPALQVRAEAVVAGWQQRNAGYLALRPGLVAELRADILARYGAPGVAEIDRVLADTIPEQVALITDRIVADIDGQADPAARIAFCGRLFADFEAGGADYANEDPQIAAFLGARLAAAGGVAE